MVKFNINGSESPGNRLGLPQRMSPLYSVSTIYIVNLVACYCYSKTEVLYNNVREVV